MTTRHLVDGLMREIRTRDHSQLARVLSVSPALISLLYHGKSRGFKTDLLTRMQHASGLRYDILMGWYHLPHDARLT